MEDELDSKIAEEQTIQLYQEMFRMVMDKCQTHSGVAVAGTMIGLAMRLYRTALSEQDYLNMMEYITTNLDLIEPFSVTEFESPTIH